MNLIDKVKKTVEKEKLIEAGDRVLLGVSGGIDSSALLYVLSEISKQTAFELGVAHLNHQLREEESERDEEFVEGLARKLSLPFYIKKADVKGYAEGRGISIQHAGRDLRYMFFEEVADKYGFNKIAVAHNLDDQVETFLLRMLKGTGIRGLASIPVKRDRIIRPFLDIYRSEIEEYVKGNALRHVKDSSNEKVIYQRNFIRKHIAPLMERVNPLFKEKIVLLLQDLTTINNLYDTKAGDFLKKEENIAGEDISFAVDALKSIDEETRFRVITSAFEKLKPDFIPLREHIRLIDKVLTSKKPNLMLVMPSNIRVKKIYSKLVFTKKPFLPGIADVFPVRVGENSVAPFGLTLDVSLSIADANMQYPSDRYTAHFDGDKVGDLFARTFQEGDRFFPLGMENSVKLKDFFISQKIPKEERRHIPLLMSVENNPPLPPFPRTESLLDKRKGGMGGFSGDDIIWVIGYRIDERYKVREDTKRILKVVAKETVMGNR